MAFDLMKHLAIFLAVVQAVASFQGTLSRPSTRGLRFTSTRLYFQDIGVIQQFLNDNYPAFYKLMEENDDSWKKLADGESYTIFAPSASAFDAIGEQKQQQLTDPRNAETLQKIGAYHAIAEVVSADELFNSGGVITLGGQIPVERSVSGGFFGIGGKEDGGVTIGGAKVNQSIEVGTGIIHEVDDFISPSTLWRYMDQLRIPGST